MPAFRDLVVYQFHIGVYYAVDGSGNDARRQRSGTFLDVVDRLEYLADLGVNAIEPLPVVEFPTTTSEGYNYTDYFSPRDGLHAPARTRPRAVDRRCQPALDRQGEGSIDGETRSRLRSAR